jgi:hypothetical protein
MPNVELGEAHATTPKLRRASVSPEYGTVDHRVRIVQGPDRTVLRTRTTLDLEVREMIEIHVTAEFVLAVYLATRE